MREQLRIGSRLSWVAAWLLAFAGPTVYVLWPGDVMWWVGLLLPMPLVGLAVWRQERKGASDQYYGGGDGGAWGPPSDAGGM